MTVMHEINVLTLQERGEVAWMYGDVNRTRDQEKLHSTHLWKWPR